MKYHLIEVCINTYDLTKVLKTATVEIKNIDKQISVTKFYINKKDKQEFEDKCIKHCIEILSINEIGLVHKIKSIKNIKTFIALNSLFFVIICVSSFFLWNIQIVGNYSHSREELIQFINGNNINTGILKKNIDCDSIEKKIRNEYDDITWVCAEVKGTNLIIHVNENYNKTVSQIENNPYDIVADSDGKIESIVTRTGVAVVKKGDEVKKGDLLITGTIDTYNEFDEKLFTKYVNADGDITAIVKLNYEKNYSEDVKIKAYKGNNYTRYNFIFGNTIIDLNGKHKNADKITSSYKLHLFKNYYLPFEITKSRYLPFEYKRITLKDKEIALLCKEDIDYYLMTLEQKQYKIIKNNVKIVKVGDKYVAKGIITVEKPFGCVSPINMNKEGTTAVNERN